MEKKCWNEKAWKAASPSKRAVWWVRDALVEVLWKIGDLWDWLIFPALCRIAGGHQWKRTMWLGLNEKICLRCGKQNQVKS